MERGSSPSLDQAFKILSTIGLTKQALPEQARSRVAMISRYNENPLGIKLDGEIHHGIG